MSKSVVVKSNGTIEYKTLDDLKSLQETVGGYIEAIYCENIGSGYVNETGKLDNLPINLLATYIWAISNKWDKLHDVLCGDVIFTGIVDEEGNTTDISDEFIKLIMNIGFNFFIEN